MSPTRCWSIIRATAAATTNKLRAAQNRFFVLQKQILRCAQNDRGGEVLRMTRGNTQNDKGKYSEGQKRTTMNDNGEGL